MKKGFQLLIREVFIKLVSNCEIKRSGKLNQVLDKKSRKSINVV